jgi:hypothetical protein
VGLSSFDAALAEPWSFDRDLKRPTAATA